MKEMDYAYKLQVFVIISIFIRLITAYGFDAGSACETRDSRARRGRAQIISSIPCDILKQGYCNLPGKAYPWHAVRRFVHENQGLMKRMYGDQRHLSVLKTEFSENNVIDDDDIEVTIDRYAQKESRTMKLDKKNRRTDIQEPHFRLQSTTSKSTTTSSSIAPNMTKEADFELDTNSVLNSTVEETVTKLSSNVADAVTTTETNEVDEISSKSTVGAVVNDSGQLFQDTMKITPQTTNNRGVNACPVKEEVVAPFWANNTRGEVLALLNLYPFEQYVHWEKCTSEHKQMFCRDGCRCEQQFSLHRLLAYDPHNECRGIFSDWFRFPSSCNCKCYDIPFEYRITSRSPRNLIGENVFERAQEEVRKAMYGHSVDEEWYRPKEEEDYDEFDGFFDDGGGEGSDDVVFSE